MPAAVGGIVTDHAHGHRPGTGHRHRAATGVTGMDGDDAAGAVIEGQFAPPRAIADPGGQQQTLRHRLPEMRRSLTVIAR